MRLRLFPQPTPPSGAPGPTPFNSFVFRFLFPESRAVQKNKQACGGVDDDTAHAQTRLALRPADITLPWPNANTAAAATATAAARWLKTKQKEKADHEHCDLGVFVQLGGCGRVQPAEPTAWGLTIRYPDVD